MEKLTLFSHVLPEEQERMRICFCMREVTYQNHEIIMEYANSMKKIGVILEGQAALYCSDADGTQYLLDELKKDSVFGEPFLLPDESQHYYVCAKTETKVLFIAYEHVIKRCENACKFHSQVVSNLLQMIAMRASQQANRIYVLSRNSTRKKIMAYLNYMAGEKKLWKPVLVLACLIGISRLYLYVHYPTDIIGGVIFGSLSGYLGYKIVEWIQKKKIK